MMEFRNPKFAAADGSLVDVEINHPQFGWIPHTVTAADNPDLDAEIRAAGGIAAYVAPPPQIPATISRFQFKAQLDADGKLSDAETLVAGSPKIVQIAWAEAVEIKRHSPMINSMADQLGYATKAAKDAFFAAAALIEV